MPSAKKLMIKTSPSLIHQLQEAKDNSYTTKICAHIHSYVTNGFLPLSRGRRKQKNCANISKFERHPIKLMYNVLKITEFVLNNTDLVMKVAWARDIISSSTVSMKQQGKTM